MYQTSNDPHVEDATTKKVCGGGVVGNPNLETTHRLHVDQYKYVLLRIMINCFNPITHSAEKPYKVANHLFITNLVRRLRTVNANSCPFPCHILTILFHYCNNRHD